MATSSKATISAPSTPPIPRTSDHPPLFPNPAVLDEVLYDYLRRADKMGWSPYDLVDEENVKNLARPDRLSETQLSAVQTVLYVEDHLPGYLSEYLQGLTHPDVPDDQYIVNRKALHYVFRWVGEEDRHAHVLEMYLKKTGLVPPAQLEADMLRERKTAYIFPYQYQVLDGFVYLALQEKATHLYYRALAKDLDEPLLKTILTKMGADEASHGAFFYDLLIKCHKGDLDALARKVSAVSNDFKMPVQSNLTNYRRQLLSLMRSAPSYKHGDVFTDMMNAIDKAAQKYSRESLTLISPDLGPFDK
ncbi:MAG TPA: acyl-ACP desaturase [Tepidisphaeraceae bacterium]|nr:acyl-ACP desaturase [Tepidisphaeraceae bacterium]